MGRGRSSSPPLERGHLRTFVGRRWFVLELRGKGRPRPPAELRQSPPMRNRGGTVSIFDPWRQRMADRGEAMLNPFRHPPFPSEFAGELLAETKAGMVNLDAQQRAEAEHPIEAVGRRIRKAMQSAPPE